jgi:hypothetical protein
MSREKAKKSPAVCSGADGLIAICSPGDGAAPLRQRRRRGAFRGRPAVTVRGVRGGRLTDV